MASSATWRSTSGARGSRSAKSRRSSSGKSAAAIVIPLLGGVKLERLTAKLLRAWALLLSESIGEREARLARLVVANILVWAGVDVRKTRALLDLPLPCRDTPQGQ